MNCIAARCSSSKVLSLLLEQLYVSPNSLGTVKVQYMCCVVWCGVVALLECKYIFSPPTFTC
jgi:hypothetical protein